jgi:type IV pilus assembly protein PilY1
LTSQKILFESTRPSGRGRVIDPNLEVDYLWLKNKHYGWYLDLPTPGERVVSDPKIRGNTVYFNTVIPDPDDCAFGGKGWMMSVALFNGGSPPKDSPAFDFNEDGAITVAGDTAEFRNERYAYSGKMFEKGGEPTGPSIVATGGQHLRYTAGTKTDEVEEIETSLLEETKRLSGRISWQQVYPD